MFKREGIKLELLDKLTFYIILATILGARFGHCIFYEPETYLHAPWKIFLPFTGTPGVDFKFTGFQGLASHGAAIGIIIGMYLYRRKYKYKSLMWILDRVVIPVALGAVFVRIGNFINSEIIGKYTNSDFGVVFKQLGETQPRHPAQLYEAFCYVFVFLICVSGKHIIIFVYIHYDVIFSESILLPPST